MIRTENSAVAAALAKWLRGANIKRIARLSGIPRSTIYAWLEEDRQVPAWAPARIFLALPDERGLEEVLGLVDLGLILLRRPEPHSSRDLRDIVLRLVAEVGIASEIVRQAAAKADLTNDERQEIDAAAEKVQRVAEELRQLARQPALRAVKDE